MTGARLARSNKPVDDLYDRIGVFLAEQGLSADPAHYRFAHAVLSDPNGPIAQAVARLNQGNARLTRDDVERLGGKAASAAPDSGAEAAQAAQAARVDRLVDDAHQQANGFATMVRDIYDQTRDFGRDLAASAAAFDQMPRIAGLDEIARVTGEMIDRIQDAEVRLAKATHETDALREKLAEARVVARRDVLTGLPNRRAFEEAFATRDQTVEPWCIALCDIDRFKRINDGHGHSVGDRVLAAVGRGLADACRDHVVARHGGEEFAVLIGGIALSKASKLLDEARAGIAAKRFRDRDNDNPLGQVTFSAGITAVQDGETVESALDRADRLLYEAKEAGRNRISVA